MNETVRVVNGKYYAIYSIATVMEISGQSATGLPITNDALIIKILWSMIHQMGIPTIVTFESWGRGGNLVSVVHRRRHLLARKRVQRVLR